MWDPQHLTILLASTACYRDNFAFYMNVFKRSGRGGVAALREIPEAPRLTALARLQPSFLQEGSQTDTSTL
jgi:hypothetical protein